MGIRGKVVEKLNTIKKLVDYLLDYVVAVYMFLILVIMPYYFTDGYSYIGTDKATFVRWCGVKMGAILGMVLLADIVVMSVRCIIAKFTQVNIEVKKECENGSAEIKKNRTIIREKVDGITVFGILFAITNCN